MGFFDMFFQKVPERSSRSAQDYGQIDIAEVFEGLSTWSSGKRFADTDPKYAELIRGLPPGTGSSMRLSKVRGTMTLGGENPKIFGYPGAIEPNMPAVTSLGGMARILIDLGYQGVDQEAPLIAAALEKRHFRLRMSCFSEQHYPLVRLQLAFSEGLGEPLYLEVLSDILDWNVQDFYRCIATKGVYEISVHVQRNHFASVFCSVTDNERLSLAGGLKQLADRLKSTSPAGWNYQEAVRGFERRHPLGEGMS
ncbi:MAG: hypothetical protein HGB36_04555 [Chlorobiaceae bacterium]|jgi:hypothetical protein|nr:hypothetical protein [Chlorobiaceae bacterium]